MSTIESLIGERMFACIRAAPVALQAGVDAATWASITAPRAFQGLGGFLGGKNRGRLPFVEFEIQNQRFMLESRGPDGGTVTSQIVLRVNMGGANDEIVLNTTSAILAAIMVEVRSVRVDNYMAIGDGDSIGPLKQGPWGHSRDCQFSVDHSYGRDNYSIQ